MSMYKQIVKPTLDIIFSLILIITLSWLFIIIVLCIKIDSPGQVIFKQKRTGKNGKIFNMYKFRTMKIQLNDGTHKLTHDERITKFGSFLRKTSLDELPQLFNILKGEMSFIGPRPWIPEYYASFLEFQKHRVDVKPGITGLAQVMGRNSIDVFKKINYDLEYVIKISFQMDVYVIFLTLKNIFKTEQAEIKQEKIIDEINMLKIQTNEKHLSTANQPVIRVLHCIKAMNIGGTETMIMNWYRNIDRTKIQFDFLVNRDGIFDREIKRTRREHICNAIFN